MAVYSSILAWRIPWTEDPGRLQSMELQKSWARLSNSTATTKAIMNINGKPRSHEGIMYLFWPQAWPRCCGLVSRMAWSFLVANIKRSIGEIMSFFRNKFHREGKEIPPGAESLDIIFGLNSGVSTFFVTSTMDRVSYISQ